MEASRGAAHLRPGFGTDLRGLIGPDRLARRAAAGDGRAFAAIFERHHQELYRYCLAILRNPADAEDALQSTMSKALQALPGERREIKLRPWLFRVAHNEAIALLRERRPERTTEDFELLGGVEPDAAAERSERLRTLVSDLKSLPERQRSALVMRELSGLEYGEIASVLDCGEGAARQTVYEARAALQTREEGRAMLCEEARRAISDGDRRRLRGRKLRAHLSGCDGCRDFETAISARRRDLAVIAPPLPAAAAAGLFAAVGGGGAATGAGFGALGGGAGTLAGGAFGTAAVKGASVAAAVVIAAGAADATGVLDLPGPLGGDGGARSASGTAAPESTSHGHHPAAGGAAHGAARNHDADKAASGGSGSGEAGGNGSAGARGAGNGNPPAGSNAGGNSGPKGTETAPGQSGSAPGQSGAAPGQSGTTPGQSGSTPGQSGTAPGQSGSTPGQSETAAPPGQAGTAPGLSGSTPGQSGTAPGQAKSSTDASSVTGSGASPSAPGQATAPGQLKKG